jgi:hypothetical protein
MTKLAINAPTNDTASRLERNVFTSLLLGVHDVRPLILIGDRPDEY